MCLHIFSMEFDIDSVKKRVKTPSLPHLSHGGTLSLNTEYTQYIASLRDTMKERPVSEVEILSSVQALVSSSFPSKKKKQ